MSGKRNAAYVVHLQCEIPVVPIVIPMSRRPYGCWHWSAAGEKLLCQLRSGLRSVAEPTGEDHFHCGSTWGHLKDIRTSMNPLTGTYTQASVRDCCHMVKSPQAPLTSDNMKFWLSHCPQCYSHWDAKLHTVRSGCREFSKKTSRKTEMFASVCSLLAVVYFSPHHPLGMIVGGNFIHKYKQFCVPAAASPHCSWLRFDRLILLCIMLRTVDGFILKQILGTLAFCSLKSQHLVLRSLPRKTQQTIMKTGMWSITTFSFHSLKLKLFLDSWKDN